MSYLAQVRLDKGQAARLHLHDSYAWHQQLWRAFPGMDGQARDFLFRLDDRGTRFGCCCSPRGAGSAGLGRLGGEDGRRELSRPRSLSLPGSCQSDGQARRSQRGRRAQEERPAHRHPRPQELCGWMERKANQAGFEMLECSAGPATQSFFVKDGRRGKHVAVDFQGTLRVVERDAFCQAFVTGIGPARAFGFGLLMLQPVA